MAETPLLDVKHLKKHFPIKGGVFSKTIGYVYAVDDINFTLEKGETLGSRGGKWMWQIDHWTYDPAAH